MDALRQLIAKYRLLLLCLLLAVHGTSLTIASEPRWSTDVDGAMEEAQRLNRPLLMHFYADWCGPCRRMDREVLHSSGLLQQLDRGFVAVKVNSDHHPELVERFDIRTLPSDVIMGPSGRVLAQNDGFQNLQIYQARLASVERQFHNAARIHIADGGSNAPGPPELGLDAEQAPTITPRRSVGPPRDGIDRSAVRVGLDGYSPIALWNNRQWQKGRMEFASSHKGVVYLMASESEWQQFRSHPERYAPQLLGCDPVVLAQSERAIRGNPQYGAYYSGMLYLFASAETRLQFSRAPHRYAQSRHTLRIDQIERHGVRLSEREAGEQSQ